MATASATLMRGFWQNFAGRLALQVGQLSLRWMVVHLVKHLRQKLCWQGAWRGRGQGRRRAPVKSSGRAAGTGVQRAG
jgi:hypothetical protein